LKTVQDRAIVTMADQ